MSHRRVHLLTHFSSVFPKQRYYFKVISDSTPGWLTDHFSFDFLALWRSTMSAIGPDSQKLKMIG